MKMIDHQAEGMNLEASLLAGFTQSFKEKLPIGVGAHDAFAAIASTQHMVDGAWILHTEFPSHPPIIVLEGEFSILLTDPFNTIDRPLYDPFSVPCPCKFSIRVDPRENSPTALKILLAQMILTCINEQL
jgi:hypothetical protein